MRDLAERHCADPDSLRARFESARPFRHLVFDGFLAPDLVAGLREQFPAFTDEKAVNEYGEVGGKAVHPDVPALGPAYARFDALMRDSAFLDWLSRATGIPQLLYDAEYVGGGTHENLDGQELDPHVDFNYHPNQIWHRRLNLILFLNEEWEESWGGCLELHRDPWDEDPWGEEREDHVTTITPRANRAVLFETTESSWHGFRRIRLPADKRNVSRRSAAVYFYTLERPAEETVPGHGTYYVPRPLPGRFAAGATLSEADVQELEMLIDRRDRQIRDLWARERETNAYLQRLHRSPSVRLAQALTWPLRALRDAIRPRRIAPRRHPSAD